MLQFNDEESLILTTLDEICKERVAPRAAEIDQEDKFPQDIRKLLAEQGIFSLTFEEKYGGFNVRMPFYCTVLEKIGKSSASVSMMVANQSLGSTPIALFGSEDMKEKYLPKLAAGELLPSFALTEPGAGSDIKRIATTAVKKGDCYVINGSKCFITCGSVADVFCVFAQVVENQERKLSVFLVERERSGVVIGRDEEKMGLHGSPTTQMFFEEVEVPVTNLIGKVGDGYRIAFATLNKGRLGTSAQSIGIAQGSLDVAAAYAKTRVQFGNPIAEFQAVQIMLADMETDIQAARMLVQESASKYDLKAPDIVMYSSMSKLFSTEMVMRVTTNAVQILGGYGYTREYPVERMMRDAKIFAIFEGTNQIQRLVIAKQLLERY